MQVFKEYFLPLQANPEHWNQLVIQLTYEYDHRYYLYAVPMFVGRNCREERLCVGVNACVHEVKRKCKSTDRVACEKAKEILPGLIDVALDKHCLKLADGAALDFE